MEEYFQLIQVFGFPVAMCIWFMIRTEKVITNNTQALSNFSIVVEHCKHKEK